MLNPYENLVIIKNEDKTDNILSWKFDEKNSGKLLITFNNNHEYTYKSSNVIFYKNPQIINFSNIIILKNNIPLSGIERVLLFKNNRVKTKYLKVFYKSGYSESINYDEIKIIKSALDNRQANTSFNYIKQVTSVVGLISDKGSNILESYYEKIDFVRADSILACFLSGKIIDKKNSNINNNFSRGIVEKNKITQSGDATNAQNEKNSYLSRKDENGTNDFEEDSSFNRNSVIDDVTIDFVNKDNIGIIYPFGFNASQKQAVDNAINNKLSIIEGPPGTGKTQTILNIIANAVIRGESVAVVSSNNSATHNILDKLEHNRVDFIAAYLGNTANKAAFINSQKRLLPDFTKWQLSKEEYSQIYTELQRLSIELDGMLTNKNNLSILSNEYQEFRLERDYFFKDYYLDSTREDIELKFFRTLSSTKLIDVCMDLEKRTSMKNIAFHHRIINLFKYGIGVHKFYKNNLQEVLLECQKLFYEKRELEYKALIDSFKAKLKDYNFEENMKHYSELSMKIFHAELAKQFEGKTTRVIYNLSDLWKNYGAFIKDYPVILSTTYSLRNSLARNFVYDYVIIDESSQVDIATGALSFSCAKKAVIVGDLKQLPNVVDATTRKKTDEIFSHYKLPEPYNYANNSILSSVSKLFKEAPHVLLREHYRCNPKIIEFCNKRFYNNQLIILTSPNKNKNKKPLKVYHTVPGNHSRENVNRREIDVILNEVIPNDCLNINDGSVGIVTPYRNQVTALNIVFAHNNIKIDTVDKFQGQEKDTIILSTVDNQITDFVDDANRLNVAISRAEEQLIVVTNGNPKTKKQKTSNIDELINYIQYNNLDIIKSTTYSIFDYLYKSYDDRRRELLKNKFRISIFDSENLMYNLIKRVLSLDEFSKYDVVPFVPLKMVLKNKEELSTEELAYVNNKNTHIDFIIFSRLDKQLVLAIEVDGARFHKKGSKQYERDLMKNAILEKYGIRLIRFKTSGSGEKEKLIEALSNA